MTTNKVIGSDGDLDRLIKGISVFYGGSTISLEGDTFPAKIRNLKGIIEGVAVVKKGKRFQFVKDYEAAYDRHIQNSEVVFELSLKQTGNFQRLDTGRSAISLQES